MPLMLNHRLAEEQFFLYALWSVNRCFANARWCIGIIMGDIYTNTGLTQEAAIFQRSFAEKVTSPHCRQLHFSPLKVLVHASAV